MAAPLGFAAHQRAIPSPGLQLHLPGKQHRFPRQHLNGARLPRRGSKPQRSRCFPQIGCSHDVACRQLHSRVHGDFPPLGILRNGRGKVRLETYGCRARLALGQLASQGRNHVSHEPALRHFRAQPPVCGNHGNKVIIRGHAGKWTLEVAPPVPHAIGHINIRSTHLIVGRNQPGAARQFPL